MRIQCRHTALILSVAPILALAGPKAKTPLSPSPQDSLGVFVDACGLLMDSVTVRPDTLIIHQNGSDAVHAKSAVAKDTVFFSSDQLAFIRGEGVDGKPSYFVGYVHRGDRKDWDDGLLIQVHPSRVVNTSRHFVKTGSSRWA